jgi:hypothetical protein
VCITFVLRLILPANAFHVTLVKTKLDGEMKFESRFNIHAKKKYRGA